MPEYVPARRLTGGLRLEPRKEQSTAGPIRRGFVPSRVVLSLGDVPARAATPCVQVGDDVLRGQTIAAADRPGAVAVHASTSGRIRAIEQRLVTTGRGLAAAVCIEIEADGRDARVAVASGVWPDSADSAGGAAAAIAAIADAGIVGLGGAAFPTAEKLRDRRCGTVIINGAECEPYISCDDMLMRERAPAIVSGAGLIRALVGAGTCIVAIEGDKPEAIEAMHSAIAASGDADITVAEVPVLYPSGGERQLIDVIAGYELPSGDLPVDHGFVCQNVGTAFAIDSLARNGLPLTSRIVTVAGGAIANPGNVDVPIGTPIAELIGFCGRSGAPPALLIHGGSMMGYELPSADVPAGKSTNCIIAALPGELKATHEEWPCIRCGECTIACPARLLPQDLLVAVRTGNLDAMTGGGLADCIDCGCCDVVCPSHIPLTSTFLHAKAKLARAEAQQRLSAESVERNRRRESRERDAAAAEQHRHAELKQRIEDPAGRQAEIRAAVERARRRRASENGD